MAGYTIKKLQGLIRKCETKIDQWSKKETASRKKWVRAYDSFISASEQLANLTRHGTKREASLKKRIESWREQSRELTKQRDAARKAIAAEKEKKAQFQLELAKLEQQIQAETKKTDEVVEQTFFLNKNVSHALEALNSYLTNHVFHLLIGEDGNLRSQITFTYSDGTRRVIAMVNAITRVQPDMAAEAKRLIEQFFDRLRPQSEMDEVTKNLFNLTKGLLIEKTHFKVGPDLYRFLGLDINGEIFPELKKAQNILRRSLRSEKTSSYIRLFQRKGENDRWKRMSKSI